jgi:hypothetical protein
MTSRRARRVTSMLWGKGPKAIGEYAAPHREIEPAGARLPCESYLTRDNLAQVRSANGNSPSLALRTCANSNHAQYMAAYFFFAAGFGAGLAEALAFAFFLSLPWELLPLAIVKSFLERCWRSSTAC